MEGAVASLDWPSAATWGALALGVCLGAVARSFAHLKRAFHQWRLDRRLARDPYILRDEMNEYRHRIGEELEPLNRVDLVKHSLAAGALYAFPIWLAENHLDQWWLVAGVAFFMLAVLIGLWRWLNDPESDPEAFMVHGDRVTFVSVAGIIGSLALVGLLLMLVIRSF